MVNDAPVDLTRIDLNLFVVFEAIYAERNITRVSERLAVTQPTISNALARLRQSLDDPLFVKTRAGMQPTALAESIAPSISEALHIMRLASRQGKDFVPAQSKRVFRLSIIEPFATLVVGKLFASVYAEAPFVELHVTRANRAELPRLLETGGVEIALDVPLRDVSDVRFQALSKESWAYALREGHSAAGRALSLDEYLSLSHLLVSSRPEEEGPVDIALRRLGRRRKIAARVQHYSAARDIIQQSDLSLTGIESWVRGLGLEVAPLPVELRPSELRLYRHRRTDGDQAINWLYDKLECVCRNVVSVEDT